MPSFARKYTIGKGKIGQIAFFYTNIIIGGVGWNADLVEYRIEFWGSNNHSSHSKSFYCLRSLKQWQSST